MLISNERDQLSTTNYHINLVHQLQAINFPVASLLSRSSPWFPLWPQLSLPWHKVCPIVDCSEVRTRLSAAIYPFHQLPRSLHHAVRPCKLTKFPRRAALPNRSLPSWRNRIQCCSPARAKPHRLISCYCVCQTLSTNTPDGHMDWHTQLSGRASQKNASHCAEASFTGEHSRLQSMIIKTSDVSSHLSTISKHKALVHQVRFSAAALLLFDESVSLQTSGANPLWP